MLKIDLTLQNYSSIHNLEFQLGQIAKIISKCHARTFPRNTVVNPNEQVNTISLRCGREVGRQPRQVMAESFKGAQNKKLAKTTQDMDKQVKVELDKAETFEQKACMLSNTRGCS